MLAIVPAEVALTTAGALERWLEPASQAAASGSRAKIQSRVSRRGMGFSGRMTAVYHRKVCGPETFIAFFTPGEDFRHTDGVGNQGYC
jgi:hypothetical protein